MDDLSYNEEHADEIISNRDKEKQKIIDKQRALEKQINDEKERQRKHQFEEEKKQNLVNIVNVFRDTMEQQAGILLFRLVVMNEENNYKYKNVEYRYNKQDYIKITNEMVSDDRWKLQNQFCQFQFNIEVLRRQVE